MFNWRIVWSSISSRLCPPVYRRWRFSGARNLTWAQLSTITHLEPELLLLPEFLDGPGIFLDVGANNGDYLYVASRKKRPSEIMAVEPIPRLSALLKRAFPGMGVHNLALTDSEGDRWLKIPDIGGKEYFTRATLNEDYREPGETGRRMIPVAATTLDSFWKKIGNPALACIKIDTEGHELSVLRGASETLARHRPMLMVEIEQRHHPEDFTAPFELLTGKNYACFYFDPQLPGLRKLEGSPAELQSARGEEARYLNNFFFLPKDRQGFFDSLERVNRRMLP